MAEEQADAHQLIPRFLGGPPLAVVGRLVLLSILVGVILAAVGLDPWNIIESVRALIVHIWTMGFHILRWLWRYFLLGAVIVVPIWLLVRPGQNTARALTVRSIPPFAGRMPGHAQACRPEPIFRPAAGFSKRTLDDSGYGLEPSKSS